jgi:hypothetical protein
MPKIPSKEKLNAAKRKLDPMQTLTAVINDMKNKDLENALVDAGLAVKVGEE